jgi:2-polyprenyl-3-methyl-5-hydroxy-6-metoxy-1,4-benzoquinol methylase
MSQRSAAHWDDAYEQRGVQGVSWFQDRPTVALELIEALCVAPTSSVIDVGGGASPLAGALVAMGYTDVTVLDVSKAALDLAKQRIKESKPCANDQRPSRNSDPARTLLLNGDGIRA